MSLVHPMPVISACDLDEWKKVNPWSLGGLFMVWKRAITSPPHLLRVKTKILLDNGK